MIKLRDHLQSKLKTIHPRVNFHNASTDTSPPYLVFDFTNSFVNEDQEVIMMDIDLWGTDSDTTALEVLSNAVWRGLHKYHHIDADIQISVYRNTRFTVVEGNPRIRRRKLTFEVKYFDRRLNDV